MSFPSPVGCAARLRRGVTGSPEDHVMGTRGIGRSGSDARGDVGDARRGRRRAWGRRPSAEPLEPRILFETTQTFDDEGSAYGIHHHLGRPAEVVAGGPTGRFLRLAHIVPLSQTSVNTLS